MRCGGSFSKLCLFVSALSGMDSPVHAYPVAVSLPISGPSVAAMLSAGARCAHISYDLNGNRLARDAATVPSASVVWGASFFGCSRWG